MQPADISRIILGEAVKIIVQFEGCRYEFSDKDGLRKFLANNPSREGIGYNYFTVFRYGGILVSNNFEEQPGYDPSHPIPHPAVKIIKTNGDSFWLLEPLEVIN